MKVKGILVVGLMVAMQACSTPPIKPFVSEFEVAENTSFTIIDNRTAQDKLTDKGSYNRMSCDFGVRKIGDDEVLPHRVDYLATRLEKEVGPKKLRGKTLQLNKFDIYFNYQLPMRTSLNKNDYAYNNSAITSMVTGILNLYECWATETHPGGYDLSKNTESKPVGIVHVEIAIDSDQFKSSVNFIPAENEHELPIVGVATIRAVDKIVEQLNDAL